MKFFKLTLLIFLTLSVIFSGAGTVSASTPDKTITVGYLDLKNFVSLDESGNYSGTGYEVLQEIAMYTGWHYRFEKVSIDTCFKKLKSGEIDIFAPIQKTYSRSMDCLYSNHYICKGTPVLTVKKDAKYCFDDYSGFEGMKIGYAKSDIFAARLKMILESHNCHVSYCEYESTTDVEKAFRNDEVDCQLVDSYHCVSNCKIILYLPEACSYIICDRSKQDLMDQIDHAMLQISHNNPYIYDNLNNKFYSDRPDIYPSFTKQEQEYINSHPDINVLLDPYSTDNNTSKEDKLLSKLNNLTGINFITHSVTEAQSVSENLHINNADIAMSINHDYTWADKNNLNLTNPYITASCIVVKNPKVKDIHTVAVPEDSYMAFTLKNKPEIQLIYGDTYQSCIDMVYTGDADATYCSEFVSSALSTLPRYHSLSFLRSYEYSFDYSIGVSDKCDVILISILNKALSCIPANDIISIYSTSPVKQSFTPHDFVYSNPVLSAAIISGLIVVTVLAVFMTVFVIIIRGKNKQLVKAANAKQNFLSNISHELRTPVSAIIGLNEIQLNNLDDPETVDECAQKIKTSSQHLISLINCVLDISRINSGKTVLEFKPFDLNNMADTINTVYQQMADRNNVTLTSHYDIAHNSYILGDELRLREVIINLISNAVKYNIQNGHVFFNISTLSMTADNVTLRFEVSDTGIGISHDQLDSIFKPFERGTQYTHTSIPGTGLGLSISEQLITLMGGRLCAESKPGKGSRFWFDLTFKLCMQKDVPGTHNSPSDTVQYDDIIPDLAGHCYLVAEDNEINRTIIKYLLDAACCEYNFACNGKEACTLFENSQLNHYSGILMDIKMPEMDGYQAAEYIRGLNRDDADSIRIIALSANAFNEDVRTSLSHGMNSHITKPIDKSKLYNELKKCEK